MLLSVHGLAENFCTFHPVATRFRHASCPLIDFFVEDKRRNDRKSIPPASVSSMNGTGRFGSSVLIRTQLDVAHFMDDATGFLTEYQSFLGFLRSSRIDFVCEPFLNFLTTTWILPIRLFIFRGYIWCNSLNGEVDF